MIAMFLIFAALGTLDYSRRARRGRRAADRTARPRPSACCSSSAPAGKSAQLPLYVWLPDAMEGPTPVSALIHAATMVTAGVYLMVPGEPDPRRRRPTCLTIIAIVGVLTALFAATIACAQNDIKKVLAYSTICQLGYMFLAVGIGRLRGRHLPHGHPRLLQGPAVPRRRLGDPRHARRAGHEAHGRPAQVDADHRVTFIIGWLAIAGVPPFAGFWSKDEILARRLRERARSCGPWAGHRAAHRLLHDPPGVPGLLRRASAGRRPAHPQTAGRRHQTTPLAPTPRPRATGPTATKPHESPWTMLVPLVVLAGLAVVGGVLNLPFAAWHVLEHWLEPVLRARIRTT